MKSDNEDDVDGWAKEVNEDIAKGEAEKHFQDIFDEMNSKQGSARVEEPPELREKLNRFIRAFELGLRDQLRGNGHGFVILRVEHDGHGTGFICYFRDAHGRPFNVAISYEDGFAQAAQKGRTDMGRGMLDLVLSRLFDARENYFRRMQGAPRAN